MLFIVCFPQFQAFQAIFIAVLCSPLPFSENQITFALPQHISTHFDFLRHFLHNLGLLWLKLIQKGRVKMITNNPNNFSTRTNNVLRSLGITRTMKAYHILMDALTLIHEQEDRLEAIQKEVYEPLADQYHYSNWTAIHSIIRRAAQTAWATNPEHVQSLAGYPLTNYPSAAQFLEMLYNTLVRE